MVKPMKKIFVCIITLSLIIAIFISFKRDHEIKKDVETFIKKEENMVISLNYPKTNIRKLDHEIKTKVDTIYNTFTEDYATTHSAELNVDYKYQLIDERYINIILEQFINTPNNDYPINKIYTYVFDIKTNKFLNLKDIMSKEEISKLEIRLKEQLIKNYPSYINVKELSSKNIIKDKLSTNFTFDNETLTIFINPNTISSYPYILDIKFPLETIDFTLDIELGNSKKKSTHVSKLTNQIIDPNKKMIAITFDDGPGRYTKSILQLLKKYDASATFFVLGNKVEIYDESTKEIIKQGSEIGNHSYNHKWLIKLKKDEFINQVNMTQDIIERTTGVRPKLLRPTYGSVNNTIKNNTDLDIVLWNVDTLDWKIKNPKRIASRVIGKVKDGDIILMHDTHKQTLEALKIILPKLKEEGYQLVTISELKEAQAIRKYNVSSPKN